MRQNTAITRILVLDHEGYWRDLAKRTLDAQGFSVESIDSDYRLPTSWHNRVRIPDLVILGCAAIGPKEDYIINHIIELHCHLVVLCATSLTMDMMRRLFLEGVTDVTEKPYDPTRLAQVINDARRSLIPRDSYEATEKEGKR